MAYDYINFSCTLSTVYGTPGLYATLTDCENAVSDGSVKPVLVLNPLWSATKKASLPLSINKLGDGYQQTVFQGVDQISEEWSITSPVLAGTQVDDLLNQLRTLCTTSFLWSPNNGLIPYKEFICDEWQKIRLSINQYQITTTFKMTILGSGLLIPYIPPTPSGDPHANNVVLFLKGDGTNGSTNIVDSSPTLKTITRFGNTQISTAQSKYGGSSILFNGNGDYLTTASSTTLQDSDYTIESWVYVSSTAGTQAIASTTPASYSRGITLKIQNGFLGFESGGGDPNLISSLAVTVNQFNHLALSKQGNNYIFAVNGVTQSIANATVLSGHGTMHIGSNARLDFPYFLNGYIDSLRVTEGVARYTTNFNPETDTYLDI